MPGGGVCEGHARLGLLGVAAPRRHKLVEPATVPGTYRSQLAASAWPRRHKLVEPATQTRHRLVQLDFYSFSVQLGGRHVVSGGLASAVRDRGTPPPGMRRGCDGGRRSRRRALTPRGVRPLTPRGRRALTPRGRRPLTSCEMRARTPRGVRPLTPREASEAQWRAATDAT